MPGDIKQRSKALVGPRGVQTVRSLGRFRWLAKVRAIHRQGARIRDDPRSRLRYVLFDPEFDNFTYELDNADALVETLARLLGRSQAELAGYLAETASDPALTTELGRRLRWRLDMKTRPPLGRRYSWYVLARALKPSLIVESGTQDGLGALALLRALRRNAAEGHPGKLLSVDTLATAGWLVPASERADWRLVIGSADEVLARTLGETPVGLFIEDTGAPDDVVRREIEAVLASVAPGAVFVAGNTSSTMQAVSREHGLDVVEHRDRARNHFFQDALTTFVGPIADERAT